jgi:hypothetical protein
MGPMGVMGAMGLAGSAGPAGSAGATGNPGPTGPQGPAGTLYGEQAAAFAGFTTATTTGSAGGREAMNAKCAAEISGSHVCHYAEYELAASGTNVPAAGAWLDASCLEVYAGDSLSSGEVGCGYFMASTDSGREIVSETGENCSNWTSGSNEQQGSVIAPTGGATDTCDGARPIACCNTPYHETFRGFTTATSAGSAGGRAAMHRICAAQFAGSHLCHLAEYGRAGSRTTPPAAGAWIDDSTWKSTDSDFGALPRSGRNTTPAVSCDSWTSASSGVEAETITAGGDVLSYCNVAHELACCGG